MPDLLRTATLVLVCCVAGRLAAQGGAVHVGAEREAGVLAVLRRLDPLEKQWLANSSFLVTPSPLGGTQVLPQIPISCGNSRMGVFDATRARRIARELFAVYRLDAKADVPLREHGVEAVLDGYDAGRKVGFKLRGVMPAHQARAGTALPEAPQAELDDDEIAKLREAGIRVHVAELKDYPLMDGDEYTPTLAWLASVVAFLDEVTDGRDVPLDAVLWQRRQRFPLGPLQVTEPVTLTLEIDGSGCEELAGGDGRTSPWVARAEPIATAGQPTRVTAGIYADLKTSSLRVTQKLGNGPAVDVEAPGMSVLMPGEFDGGKPFTIVLKLAPGMHCFDAHLVVGCPRR